MMRFVRFKRHGEDIGIIGAAQSVRLTESLDVACQHRDVIEDHGDSW